MLCLRQTTIRVRFGDLTQLEKVFPSSSKIRAVYAFVRDALREDVKPIKFVLCAYVFYSSVLVWSSHIALRATASNPPPRELKVSDPAVRDLTLAELGLAPSSVLHLRFVDDELNRKSFFRPFPRFPFAFCRAERQHECCRSLPLPLPLPLLPPEKTVWTDLRFFFERYQVRTCQRLLHRRSWNMPSIFLHLPASKEIRKRKQLRRLPYQRLAPTGRGTPVAMSRFPNGSSWVQVSPYRCVATLSTL